MKTVADQIRDLENTRAAKMSRMEEIPQKSFDEGRSMDEAESEEFDTIEQEIKQIDEELVRLNRLQKMMAHSAQPVDSDPASVDKGLGKPKGPTIITEKPDPEDKFQGQSFTRMAIAKALSKEYGVPVGDIAQQRWGKTNPKLVQYIKADVAGHGSGSGEAGSELVVNVPYVQDFIEFLYARTVYNQLPLREVPANVTIGEQDGAHTGYWVGESKAIPVSVGDYNAVNLAPKKVGALAVASKEWIRDATWPAEMLVRDSLITAAAERIDTTFVSNSVGTASTPAGIMYNIAGTESNGTDGDAVANDVKEMLYRFITAKNSGGLWHIMNPSLASALALMRNALDQYEFPDIDETGGTLLKRRVVTGDNVNANHFITIKPSDIYRIGTGSVEVSMSDTATIEMANNPGMDTDTPTAATGKLVGMFQTESIAFKIVHNMNFARRRDSAVAWIKDADYGGAIST